MKNKTKLMTLLMSLSLLPLTSCNKDRNSNCNVITNTISRNFEIINPFKKVYGVGEIIDFDSTTFEIKYNNGNVKTINGFDSQINIKGGDTEKEGTYNIIVTYDNQKFEFQYIVKQFYVTLNFNGGTYNNQEEIKIPLYNRTADLSSIIPTYKADETKFFSGWFYDKEMTQRVDTYQVGKNIKSSTDIKIYAGYDLNFDDKFTYAINETDNTCTLVSLNFETYFENYIFDSELVIPKTINGYPVTEIGADFFKYKPKTEEEIDYAPMLIALTKITFEEGSKVEKIGDRAFNGLSNLNEINFPSSLLIIGEEAFTGTDLSGDLVLNKNLVKIGKGAFSNLKLERVTFEKGTRIKVIGEDCFSYNEFLYEIELPEGLEEIRENAFYSCNDLTYIKIPSTLKYISGTTFMYMGSLNKIEVDKNNQSFLSIDGNLYSKDKHKLIRYCYKNNETEFVVPSEVTQIATAAFSIFDDFKTLIKLTLPERLSYIGNQAFTGCTFSLTLPASLESFSLEAFSGYEGKEINVDSKNKKYKSKDGILYSNDYKTLYLVPKSYQNKNFTLDDRVEIISKNAIYDCTNIESIYISENSSLKEVYKNGMLFTNLKKLKYVKIEKKENISFSFESFFSAIDLNNENFQVIFKSEDVYENFMDQLKSLTHPKYYDDVINLVYEHFTTDSNIIEKTLDKIANSVGFSYLDFTTSLNVDSMLDILDFLSENSKNALAYTSYCLSENKFDDNQKKYAINFLKRIYYSLYLQAKESIYNIYSAYSNLKSYYDNLDSSIQNEVKEYMILIDRICEFTKTDKIKDEINQEILTFPLSSSEFDCEKFKKLKTKIDNCDFLLIPLITVVYNRYQLLLCNYKIATIIDTDLNNCSDEKILDIYNTVYNSDEASMSISNYLNSTYTKTEFRKQYIYRLDDFNNFQIELEKKIKTLSLKFIEKLENFDFSTFNYNTYYEFYEQYILTIYKYWSLFVPYFKGKQYYSASETEKIINTICVSIDIYTFNNQNLDGKSDQEIVNIYKTQNNIDSVIFNKNCTEYGLSDDMYNVNINDLYAYEAYKSKKNEVKSKYDNIVKNIETEIANIQISSSLSQEIVTNLYNRVTILDSDISKIKDLSDQARLKFSSIMIFFTIKIIFENYPSLSTKNKFDVKKFIYGYYNLNDYKWHNGAKSYIDEFLEGTVDENGNYNTSYILNYNDYEELLTKI